MDKKRVSRWVEFVGNLKIKTVARLFVFGGCVVLGCRLWYDWRDTVKYARIDEQMQAVDIDSVLSAGPTRGSYSGPRVKQTKEEPKQSNNSSSNNHNNNNNNKKKEEEEEAK